MKRKTLICLLLMTILWSVKTKAQDPAYSQFLNNPIYYNPAYTGLYKGIRARFSFRDQWPALPYDFKAYHLDADIGDRNLPGSGGIGLFMNTDNEGIGFIRNFNLGISLAVRIPFTEQAVGQLGIKASWLQKSVDWDDFVFTDALSEKYGTYYQTGFVQPANNVRNMADFGVGGIVQFGNDGTSTTLGFSVDHLFEPDQSFLQTAKAPIPRKYVAHADLVIDLAAFRRGNSSTGPLKLNPGAVVQVQDGLSLVQAGINLSKFGLITGIWYKGTFGEYHNSAMTFMAGYGLNYAQDMGIRFTYSYDMQMAGALMGTGGAHELSLILDFNSGAVFGDFAPRGSRMRGGHWEGKTPWECATNW
jgi:type IX secretion system PorP/SprF family membrane protein